MPKGLHSAVAVPGITISSRRVVTATDSADAQLPLGFRLEADDGRLFQYVNAREALLLGQLCTILNPDDGDVSAGASDNTLTTAGGGDFTAAEFDDNTLDRREYYAFINANTGAGQCRRIVSNSATVLTLDASWDTAIDATSDYIDVGPYHVNITTGVSQCVVGIALGAVTSASNAWIQKKGFCPVVRCVGSVDPTILGRGVVSSATGGTCKGPTGAGMTAAEADVQFGKALAPYGAADVASRGVPVLLDCV